MIRNHPNPRNIKHQIIIAIYINKRKYVSTTMFIQYLFNITRIHIHSINYKHAFNNTEDLIKYLMGRSEIYSEEN